MTNPRQEEEEDFPLLPHWPPTISERKLGCLLILVSSLGLWGLWTYAYHFAVEYDAEVKRGKYERDTGTGHWASQDIVLRLQPMQEVYRELSDPSRPIRNWSREKALRVCETMGKLHRHPNQSPAGTQLDCDEHTQGCMVREWYLSRR